jgi:hypothetical protein
MYGPIFKKHGEDTLAPIRTIVVLTGGKLIGIYFPHLLYVTTHRRQGRKVSILPLSDMNPGPVPSR